MGKWNVCIPFDTIFSNCLHNVGMDLNELYGLEQLPLSKYEDGRLPTGGTAPNTWFRSSVDLSELSKCGSDNLQLLSKFIQGPRAALCMLDWPPQWSYVADLPDDHLPCWLCLQDADYSMSVLPCLLWLCWVRMSVWERLQNVVWTGPNLAKLNCVGTC